MITTNYTISQIFKCTTLRKEFQIKKITDLSKIRQGKGQVVPVL